MRNSLSQEVLKILEINPHSCNEIMMEDIVRFSPLALAWTDVDRLRFEQDPIGSGFALIESYRMLCDQLLGEHEAKLKKLMIEKAIL